MIIDSQITKRPTAALALIIWTVRQRVRDYDHTTLQHPQRIYHQSYGQQ